MLKKQVKVLLQYYVTNIGKHAKECAHHMLFRSYEFRKEDLLTSLPYCGTYLAKLQGSGVLEINNSNRCIMEQYSTLDN